MTILVLSLVLSIDALSFGMAFGIKGISIPKRSLALISLIGLLTLAIAMLLGNLLNNILPFCNIIGSLLLIGIGIWICTDTKEGTKNIKGLLDNPELGDLNKSGIIEYYESVIIGITLSLDAAAVALTSTLAGFGSIILPISIMISQLIFLTYGAYLGKKLKLKINSKYITIISGLIIILIGLYGIIPLIY